MFTSGLTLYLYASSDTDNGLSDVRKLDHIILINSSKARAIGRSVAHRQWWENTSQTGMVVLDRCWCRHPVDIQEEILLFIRRHFCCIYLHRCLESHECLARHIILDAKEVFQKINNVLRSDSRDRETENEKVIALQSFERPCLDVLHLLSAAYNSRTTTAMEEPFHVILHGRYYTVV